MKFQLFIANSLAIVNRFDFLTIYIKLSKVSKLYHFMNKIKKYKCIIARKSFMQYAHLY